MDKKMVWNNPEISKVKVISLQLPQFLFRQKKLGWNDNSTYSLEVTLQTPGCKNRSSPAGMTWFPFLGDPESQPKPSPCDLASWGFGGRPGHHHQDLWRSPGRLADAAVVRPPVAAPAAWPEAGPGWGARGTRLGSSWLSYWRYGGFF